MIEAKLVEVAKNRIVKQNWDGAREILKTLKTEHNVHCPKLERKLDEMLDLKKDCVVLAKKKIEKIS